MENKEKKLKFENAFETPVVIDWDYYVKYYTLPTTANQEQYLNQETLIKKWIIQATDDINGLCNGRVYAEWDLLDETNIIDQQRASYLQKAIAKWVEFCICTGHIWANREDVVQGNIPISVRTESKNNEIEFQRKDIVKLLKIGRWYQEVFTDWVSTSSYSDTSSNYDELITYLNGVYVRADGRNWTYANLDFAGWGINNVGNLVAAAPTTVGANSVIDGFQFKNCIFTDKEADRILDIDDGFYKYGSNLLKWNNYYTKMEMKTIINEFQNARVWKPEIRYFQFQGCIATYSTDAKSLKFEPGKTYQFYSLVSNNLGNDPFTSPEFWEQISMDIDYDLLHLWIQTEIGVKLPIEVEMYISNLAEAQAPFSVGTFVNSQFDPSNTSFEYLTLPNDSNRYYSLTEDEKIKYPQLTEWLHGEPIDRMEYGTTFLEDAYVDNLLSAKKITKSDNTPYAQVGLNEVLNKKQLDQKFLDFDEEVEPFNFTTFDITFNGYYVKQRSGLIIYNLDVENWVSGQIDVALSSFRYLLVDLTISADFKNNTELVSGVPRCLINKDRKIITFYSSTTGPHTLTIIGRWK